MESAVTATTTGRIESIHVTDKSTVETGDLVIVVKAE